MKHLILGLPDVADRATSLSILLFAGKFWKVTPLSLSFSVRFLQLGTEHDGIKSQRNKQDRI